MAAVDLLFAAQPYGSGPVGLVFGGAGGAAPDPVVVTHSATLPPPTFAMALVYDNRVTRWRDQRVGAPHQVAVRGEGGAASAWGISHKELGGTDLKWAQASPSKIEVAAPWKQNAKRRTDHAAVWQAGSLIENTAAAVFEVAAQRRYQAGSVWQIGQRVGISATERVQTATRLLLQRRSDWNVASRVFVATASGMGASVIYRSRSTVMPWEHARHPAQGREVWPPVGVVPPVGYVPDTNLRFQCPPHIGLPLHLVFGSHPCGPELPGETIIVPVRRVYIVINEASLRRVDGNIALPTFNMSLNIDADSWTWSFSAALPGSVLSDLEPATSGAPVEVEAMINGVAYRALVERIGRDRSFGKSGIRVQGRGKTALLDSPYAPVKSFFNEGARTAQQLMADVLTVNEVPMDWTVNWGLEDWLVPANVFSHQGSYISALNAIATAAGGYIQPHASLQTISVLPRYQSAPWNWGAVVPDIELPSDVTTREGIEWVEKARYNRVFVSGQQSGILGQVTRAGTAGDLLAPMVTDALITTAAAARQRGLSVLANTGRQADVSLRLPVLAETGVITPGKFVRYTDAGTVRLGVVRSTAIEVGMPEIWQNLGVETHA